jgi:uncharacterized protein YbbC (DUF1343 family)
MVYRVHRIAATTMVVALAQAPGSAGLSADRLARIDSEVQGAVDRGEIPGAVVVAGRGSVTIYQKAFGFRALEPQREAMTVDTVFDLASLTKVVATATSIMVLAEDGKLKITDPVARYIPQFAAGNAAHARTTLEDLLLHRSGLPADDPLDLYRGTPGEIFGKKYGLPRSADSIGKFIYSDINYEVLGEVVRVVSGKPLDAFARERIFHPLEMHDTGFRRPGESQAIPVQRCAPTEKVGAEFLRGTVHDPRARALGGVAGHAGLFGTGADLAKFCIAILHGGGGVLSPAGVLQMTRARFYPDTHLRGLGWDIATAYSAPRGELFPLGSFGHTGFTGTSIWLDPVTQTFVILLTNANHRERGAVGPLRGRVATLVAAAVEDVDAEAWRRFEAPLRSHLAHFDHRKAASAPHGEFDTLAGVDTLEASGFTAIAGRRVALLTNSTGRTRDGRTTVDVLRSAGAQQARVRLVKLFTPEHGILATADGKVADSIDPISGLPVTSLYGETRRPRPKDLEDIDAIVIDLQDAGCRFYTYLATTGYVLEEAAKRGLRVVVLDRPSPAGSANADGPLSLRAKSSFVAYHDIPVQTGMTIGELAWMFNEERGFHCDLEIVKMSRYRRESWYDDTGLRWIPPSPNLRSISAAALYPALCLLEFTNVSVGRGTDAPFLQFGAPWLDGERAARELNLRNRPGIRYSPVRFTPSSSTFAGDECSGVRIEITDRSALQPVRAGFDICIMLRDRFGALWKRERFGELIANDAFVAAFEKGETADELFRRIDADLATFAPRREKFLLYGTGAGSAHGK